MTRAAWLWRGVGGPRLLLAGVVLATSAVAIRHYSGHDFIHNVWAPSRGLLDGLNPYDPAGFEYVRRYNLPVVAGFYMPAALALHAPLVLLSRARATDVMAVLNTALIWLGVLLLIPPRSARTCIVAAVAGMLLIGSEPARHTVYLGQLSASAFVGLALLVTRFGKDPSATWLPAVGMTLVALKPQSGVPIFVALGILGFWRVLARAAGMLILLSVPGAVLFVRAAGSPSAIIRTVSKNLDLFARLPPNDLANPSNLRIDLLGLISHLGGPALTGVGWILVIFVVVTGLFALALRSCHNRRPWALADPYIITLTALYVVTSLHHLTYDQLMLYVGPFAAFATVVGGERASPRTRVVATGGLALMGAGLVFREGIRRRIAFGLPTLGIHHLWAVIPTLIMMAVVGAGWMVDRRVRWRNEPRLRNP